MTTEDFDDYFDPKEPDAEEVSEKVEAKSKRGKHSKESAEPPTTRPENYWDEKDKVVELPPEPPPEPHPPSPSMPGVKEVTYSQPMDLAQLDPNAKGPWIQYNGVATVRIMDRRAWAQASVKSDKYCEWNYMNGKRLPRSMFNDEELQYLLRVDGRFSLEKE